MSFFDDYKKYKNDYNLVDKFLINIGALEFISFLDNINIESNHTYDGRESRATIESIISYPNNINHIKSLVEIEHGLFDEGIFNIEDYPDGIKDLEHYEELTQDNPNILESSFNEAKNTLAKSQYDNYNKTIKLTFDFIGESHDVDILNNYTYYVYVKLIMANKQAAYWCNLVVEAIELEKEKKYELALLLMFSAFDNLITLETEKLNNNYFKELDLEKLEFGKKVSLLLKHKLDVTPGSNSEKHPVKELILKMYKELYDLRNAVAHGNIRAIAKDDFEKCLDMLIFTFTAISRKPIDNIDLLKKIKNY